MSQKTTFIALIVLITSALAILGCSLTDPEETTIPPESNFVAMEKAANSITLVPNWDVSNTGWIGYPDAVDSLYRYIDEGVPNSPNGDLIYTHYQGAQYRFEFSDMPTGPDVDVSSIEIQTFSSLAAGDALKIWLDMSIYINDELVGTETFECGEMPGVECSGLDISHTFDGLCFDAEDINTLELELYVNGIWWDPGSTSAEIQAVDAIIHFDSACDPEIQNLEVGRHGNNFSVVWDTPCDATSEVIWGYSPTALTNSVTGGAGTHHIRNFTAADNEGCVYMKAIATGTTCSALADTSALQTSVKDVVVSNINRTFDPVNCTMIVTWDTNVKSSSKLYWGTSCASLSNVGTGAGNTTSHSVTVDVWNVGVNSKLFSVPESASGCDSAQGACGSVKRLYCFTAE